MDSDSQAIMDSPAPSMAPRDGEKLMTNTHAKTPPKTTFEAVLGNPEFIGKLVAVLADFVDYVQFNIEPSGISMSTMDTAHVFVVQVDLPAEAFREYRTTKHAQRITVKADTLHRVLRQCKQADEVQWSLDTDELTVMVARAAIYAKRAVYKLALTELDTQAAVEMPDTDHTCALCIPAAAFKSLCDDLHALGDELCIEFDEQAMVVRTDSQLLRTQVSVEPPPRARHAGYAISCTEKTTALFKSDYLTKMRSAAGLKEATDCLVQMSDETPLCVSIDFGNLGNITFHLAPLVEADSMKD